MNQQMFREFVNIGTELRSVPFCKFCLYSDPRYVVVDREIVADVTVCKVDKEEQGEGIKVDVDDVSVRECEDISSSTINFFVLVTFLIRCSVCFPFYEGYHTRCRSARICR